MSPLVIPMLLVASLSAPAVPMTICGKTWPWVLFSQNVTWSGSVYEIQPQVSDLIASESGDAPRAAVMLQMDTPSSVISMGAALQSQCDVQRVQLVLAPGSKLDLYALRGQRVTVTGILGHAFTPAQRSFVILTVDEVHVDVLTSRESAPSTQTHMGAGASPERFC